LVCSLGGKKGNERGRGKRVSGPFFLFQFRLVTMHSLPREIISVVGNLCDEPTLVSWIHNGLEAKSLLIGTFLSFIWRDRVSEDTNSRGKKFSFLPMTPTIWEGEGAKGSFFSLSLLYSSLFFYYYWG
jgi:hypothetical protein